MKLPTVNWRTLLGIGLLLAALLAGGYGGQRDAGHDSLDDHARKTGLAFMAAVLPRKRCLIHGHAG